MGQHVIGKRPGGDPAPTSVKVPPTPKNLSPTARKLWRSAWSSWRFNDIESALLERALRLHDMAESALETIRRDGPVVESPSGLVRAHPGVKVAKDLSSEFRACMKSLGLIDVEAL